MTTAATLWVKLALDSKDYKAGLQQSQKATTSFAKGVKVAAAGAVTAMAVAAGKFLKESTLLAARADTLAVVTEQMGKNIGLTTEQVRGFEESIQSMGITTIASREAIAQLIRAEIDLTKASDLARLAQNAAVIAGENSSQAFSALSTIIATGNTLMARRRGLIVDFVGAEEKLATQLGKTREELTSAEKSQARLNEVLSKGDSIAGVYEASMETAGKQAASFARHMEELQVAIGAKLQGAFGTLIRQATNVLKTLKLLVQWSDLTTAGFEEQKKILKLTSGSYEEYAEGVIAAAVAAGKLTEKEADLLRENIKLDAGITSVNSSIENGQSVFLGLGASALDLTEITGEMSREFFNGSDSASLLAEKMMRADTMAENMAVSIAGVADSTVNMKDELDAFMDLISSDFTASFLDAQKSVEELRAEEESLLVATQNWMSAADASEVAARLGEIPGEIEKIEKAWETQTAKMIVNMLAQNAALDGVVTDRELAIIEGVAARWGLVDEAMGVVTARVLNLSTSNDLTVQQIIAGADDIISTFGDLESTMDELNGKVINVTTIHTITNVGAFATGGGFSSGASFASAVDASVSTPPAQTQAAGSNASSDSAAIVAAIQAQGVEIAEQIDAFGGQ